MLIFEGFGEFFCNNFFLNFSHYDYNVRIFVRGEISLTRAGFKIFFAQRDIITNYEICVERKLQRVELINLKCIYNNLFSGYVYSMHIHAHACVNKIGVSINYINFY